jgi:hypothetical protein
MTFSHDFFALGMLWVPGILKGNANPSGRQFEPLQGGKEYPSV